MPTFPDPRQQQALSGLLNALQASTVLALYLQRTVPGDLNKLIAELQRATAAVEQLQPRKS